LPRWAKIFFFYKISIDKDISGCYNTVDTDSTDNTDSKEGTEMPIGFTGKRDVYLEVAERYEKYIKLGVLRDGDKLPSVRTAAGELGINPNTVQKAYAYLESKGLICTVPKKGVFVTSEQPKTDGKRTDILKTLNEYKEMGISYSEMTDLLKEVYSDD